MKKYLFIAILLFSSTLIYSQSYVTTSDVNVRKGAGSGYEILGVINNGTTIEVLSTSGKWSRISYQGSDGYIATKLLQPSGSEKAATTNTIASTDGVSFKTYLIIGIIILLLIFRPTRRLIIRILKLAFPETAANLTSGDSITQDRQVYCSKCGETKRTTGVVGNTPNCTAGGRHNWTAY